MPAIAVHIKPVLRRATLTELIQIYLISVYGREYFAKNQEFFSDTDIYKNQGLTDEQIGTIISQRINKHYQVDETQDSEYFIDQITMKMQEAIQEGLENPLGMKTAYTEQLKLCINLLIEVSLREAKNSKDKVWEKSLKDNRKSLTDTPDCNEETAMKHEETIVSLLLEGYLRKLSPEDREKLEDDIRDRMDSLSGTFGQGVNAGQLLASFTTGGLTALRSLLGFQFHKMLAVIVNAISKALFKVGLPLAWNAILQRFAGILFGPLGWFITAITTIPNIAAIINPRQFDRYIPVIVYIYTLRHQDDIQFINDLPEDG